MSQAPTPEVFEERAESVSRSLPALLLEAERIANTVALGAHGRRRSGMGETFWQYRRFRDGDAPTAIDWRKSARSHNLYVRENEWEAAGTVWLWMNRSPSMAFHSHLAAETKAENALVLLLALAMLLVRGGERVGLLGTSSSARSDRFVVPRLAEALAVPSVVLDDAPTLPPDIEIGRFANLVLFADFLDPLDAIHDRIARFADRDVRGHLVQVLDPAEETFPFNGRFEFRDAVGADRLIIGRAERVRADYRRKLADHRAGVQRMVQRLGWSFSVHHTDAPATAALLALFAMLSGEVELASARTADHVASVEARA